MIFTLRSINRVSLFLLLFLLLLYSPLEAAIIRVDSRVTASGDGTSWAKARQTISEAIAAANDGDEIWVAAGTYLESITMKSGIALYGGFSGAEAAQNERDPLENKTIINAGSSIKGAIPRRVISINSIVSSRLDGFIITGGKATCTAIEGGGGGILCRQVDATNVIANCSITTNSVETFYTDPYAYRAVGAGGGILCLQASPQITSCTISGNASDYAGGAIYCDGSSAVITGCIIGGNKAAYGELYPQGYGGGIYCTNDTNILIKNASIFGNVGFYGGGGIHCQASRLEIENTSINGNTSYTGAGIYCWRSSVGVLRSKISGNGAEGDSGGRGGGIYLSSKTNLMIRESALCENRAYGGVFEHSPPATGAGGAIYCTSESNARLINCVLARNSVSSEYSGYLLGLVGSGEGAAVYLSDRSRVSIENCTIAANETKQRYIIISDYSSRSYPQLYAGGGLFCSTTSTASVVNTIFQDNANYAIYEEDTTSDVFTSHCLFYNNHQGDHYDPAEKTRAGVSALLNKNADSNYWGSANFVNPAIEDYHLANGSAALDRGLASAAPGADLEGNDRPGGDGLVDIGAYESVREFEPSPEPNVPHRIYVKKDAKGSETGENWANAVRTISQGLMLARAFAIPEIWVAAGLYPETFQLSDGIHIYGGFSGTETSLSERNPKVNQTLINGLLDKDPLHYHQPAHIIYIGNIVNARLDGFCIINAKIRDANSGFIDQNTYSIYSDRNASSSVVLANCLISENPLLLGRDMLQITNCAIGSSITYRYTSSTIASCVLTGSIIPGAVNTSSPGGSPAIINSIMVGNRDGSFGFLGGTNQITNSVFDSNTAGVSVSTATLVNSIFCNNDGYGISGSGPAFIKNCLFFNNAKGDLYDDRTKASYTGGDSINQYVPGAEQNITGNPLFRKGMVGKWDASNGVVYNSAANITTLTDSRASFTTGSLLGRAINPDITQKRHAIIINNTPHAIFVAANLTTATHNAANYEIRDFHILARSSCIDAGRDVSSFGSGSALDMDSDVRPCNGDGFTDGEGEGARS